jgi:hypothetical protein
MDTNNELSNQKLFNIGVKLVKFAWAVEILAVTIGFLISIIVSFSVYAELNKTDRVLSFGDYSSILVAALPFVLVAVVEAAKIPVATALMYAKHFWWRVLFFIGLVLLATITFETMLNGFERNFSGLNITIDEKKNGSLLLQDKVDVLENRKEKINIINLQQVDNDYRLNVQTANNAYYTALNKEREHINKQITQLNNEAHGSQQYQTEIDELHAKEGDIYDAWDQERDELQKRLRSLLNNYVAGTQNDKQQLQQELDDLKAEMKTKLSEAGFFTRGQVETKYRKLIAEKEERLYSVADRSTGSGALDKQTQSEKQLQDQLQILGQSYQKRIDLGRTRIAYLEKQILEYSTDNEQKRQSFRANFNTITKQADQLRSGSITRAAKEKDVLITEYDVIQQEVKIIDKEIYSLNQKQSIIKHDINRLVNSNQIYRLAAYISDKEQAIDVPKSTVGLVALVWFSSLAFISAVTGVFLAIAGIYMQRIYAKENEYREE